jgi:type IV pilus biogenesis protein CpaD/CtpE
VNPHYLGKGLDTDDPNYEENKHKLRRFLPKPTPIGEYVVNIAKDSEGRKVYECPACRLKSGLAAVANPSDLMLSAHSPSCPNNGKIPIELGRY